MHYAGFISEAITTSRKIILTDITSLTVSNYGNNVLQLKVNGVKRPVPAFNVAYGVPVGAFNLPGDGTVTTKLELEFEFTGDTGNAILDYRKLNKQNCTE